MPYDMQHILYCEVKQSLLSHTREPTGRLDVSRLAANHRDYWVREASSGLRPKTLVLADWTAFNWSEEKINQTIFVFNDLLGKGFSIYIWLSSTLKKLTTEDLGTLKNYTIRRAINAQKPHLIQKQLATEHRVPIDQISILDPFFLSWILGARDKAPEGVLALSCFGLRHLSEVDEWVDEAISAVKASPTPLKTILIDTYKPPACLLRYVQNAFPGVDFKVDTSTHAVVPAGFTALAPFERLQALYISCLDDEEEEENEDEEDGIDVLRTLTHLTRPEQIEKIIIFDPSQSLLPDNAPLSAIHFAQLKVFRSKASFNAKLLYQLIHTAKHLEVLSVTMHQAEHAAVELDALQDLRVLAHISVNAPHNELDILGLMPLLKAAKNTLKKLELEGFISGSLGDLETLPQVIAFHLESHQLDYQSIQTLLNAMPNLSTLRLLFDKDNRSEIRLEPHSLKQLRTLRLSTGEEIRSQNPLLVFKKMAALLNAAPQIETLTLSTTHDLPEGTCHLDECDVRFDEYLSLLSIQIFGAIMTSTVLERLLESSPVIRTLEISSCRQLGAGRFDLAAGSLKYLTSLTIEQSSISSMMLDVLLAASPNLETLLLASCRRLSHRLHLAPNSLNQLKKLVIKNASISSQSLEILLSAAPNIETLELSACTQLSDNFNLVPRSLDQLSTIKTYSTSINLKQMGNLLGAAFNIKELHLCFNSHASSTLKLEPNSLMALEVIYIKCLMTARDLDTLLSAAPHLKKLSLLIPKNQSIIREELNTVLSRYPHLNIVKTCILQNLSEQENKRQDRDLVHSVSRFFNPEEAPEPFDIELKKINTTKNQGRIIRQVSLYLHALEKNSQINALQGGICVPLSYYFLHKSPALFEWILTKIFDWDGTLAALYPASSNTTAFKQPNRNDPLLLEWIQEREPTENEAASAHPEVITQDSRLVSIFNELMAYISKYQKKALPYQYLGNQLIHYLSNNLPDDGAVFINPWHAIAIKPLDNHRFLIYDPNYINGPKSLALTDLPLALEHALGSLVGVITTQAIQASPLINDWNQFIGEGGVFMLRCTNSPLILAQVPDEYEYSNDALKGLLLLSTDQIPAWYIGMKNSYSSYTRRLLVEFTTKNPTISYQALIKSISALNESMRIDALQLIQDLPFIAEQIQEEAMYSLQKDFEKKYARFFETWSTDTKPSLSLDELCQRITRPTCASRLIKLSSEEYLRTISLVIEQHCASTKRPFYFIKSAEDLVCSAPYIRRTKEGKGTLCKGPGGPFHDFISTHPGAVVLVDFSKFEPDDIAVHNTMTDKIAFVDGTPLNEILVIGLINTSCPNYYQGSDFYSRFEESEQDPLSEALFEQARPGLPFISKDGQDDEDGDVCMESGIIHLYHRANWKHILLGGWVLHNMTLVFEEGLLLQALNKHPHVRLKNAPWDDPDFLYFWQRACMRRVIDHDSLSINLPDDFLLIKETSNAWRELCAPIELCCEYQAASILLNPHELPLFFAHYEHDTLTKTLRKTDGWIKKSQGLSLSVFLTRALSEEQWALLLDECIRYSVRLKIYPGHGSMIPAFLAPEDRPAIAIAQKPLWSSASTAHTQIIYSTDPDTSIAQITQNHDWLVIDVSECTPYDLFESLQPEFDADGVLSFCFTSLDGVLTQALKTNKKIVLTGVYSKALEDVLTSTVLARHKQDSCSGRLCIITSKQDDFPALQVQKHSVTQEEQYAQLGNVSTEIKNALRPYAGEPLSSLKARCAFLKTHPERCSDALWQGLYALDKDPYDSSLNTQTAQEQALLFHEQRKCSVNAHLAENPYVFLSGLSGVGKTTFVKTQLCSAHDDLYEGEKAMESWAKNTAILPDNGRHILFLDEATLSARHWSEVESLFHTPWIRIGNQCYKLTPQHKIVFAGNPVSCGDERHLASLLKRHGKALLFKPLPAAVLYEDIIKPVFSGTPLETQVEILCVPFLKAYGLLLDAATDDVLISPRELQMMALLTLSYCSTHPQANPLDIAQHYAFELTRPLVPKSFESTFYKTIKDCPLPQAQACTEPSDDEAMFIMTPSRQVIYQQLKQLLKLREYRQKEGIKNNAQCYGGLGGVVLEGMPGVGKSELIISLLNEQGFEEKRHDSSQSPLDRTLPCAKKSYYRMPASMSCSEKKALLLQAFHEGAVVIYDEMNASPMMEDFMNALLTGSTQEGRRPCHPGFLLIGTQNPATLPGRRVASTALSRRLLTIELPPYTQEELITILQAKGLNPPKAKAMSIVFLKKVNEAKTKNYSPEPTFRDLLKQAQRLINNARKRPEAEAGQADSEDSEPQLKYQRRELPVFFKRTTDSSAPNAATPTIYKGHK